MGRLVERGAEPHVTIYDVHDALLRDTGEEHSCRAAWHRPDDIGGTPIFVEHRCILPYGHGLGEPSALCVCECGEPHASDAGARRVALIVHPTEGGWNDNLVPELIDVGRATMLACVFDDGWYMAIERVFGGWGEGGRDFERMHALHQQFRPSYAQIRDHLRGEHNVPLVLAARIALRHTTPFHLRHPRRRNDPNGD